MKIAILVLIFAINVVFATGQPAAAVSADGMSAAQTLAKAAFEAHGGEKLSTVTSLTMTGSVDITSSAFNQAFPATFAQVFSGEKYRLEVNGGVMNFLQVFDGVNTFTVPSQGFQLPPINRIGFALLQRFGQPGFVVSELDDTKKNGFRITSPEAYFTDFYTDKKTNRIKGYDSSYTVAGRAVTTVVEINKYEENTGIVVPSKFAQRFDVSGMTIYAVFKSKEISINGEVSDDLFIP